MKTVKTLALSLCALSLLACNKNKNPEGPIDFEKEYTELYALGGAVNKWDSMDPEPMTKTSVKDVFAIEVDLIKSNENKLIKFCMTAGKDWSETDYLVPVSVEADKAYCFLKEGENKIQHSSVKLDGEGNLKDWFFGLEAGMSGHWRLEVNPRTLTVNATKLSSLPDKEELQWEDGMVYMVGDATPAGWDINAPTPMVKNGDIFTYEGALAEGEMKFPVEFRWDGPTYMAEEAGVEIAAGNTYNVVLSPNGDPDNKFKCTAAGNYKLTLDTKALTLKVE